MMVLSMYNITKIIFYFGDGTLNILFDDNRIIVVSLHRQPYLPRVDEACINLIEKCFECLVCITK